jgi:hypothetical protein
MCGTNERHLNAEEEITVTEFVGAKQFGVKHFAELLRGAANVSSTDPKILRPTPKQLTRLVTYHG